MKNYIKHFFKTIPLYQLVLIVLVFGTNSMASAWTNPELDNLGKTLSAEEDLLTCSNQLAYWSLDACESFSSNGSNLDYSEFTPNTNTPAGFSNVSATNLTHQGGHSCTYGQSGLAMCSGIRDQCSWADNDPGAFRFSVTLTPENGSTARLSAISFYERAPLNYNHVSGNSGDNDPPSHYGIRVLKNGQEIYQKTGRNTTHDWSLENFDLSSDPDFEVSSTTTFQFELLGYCRSNGTSGLAVWDLDEIKVFGCAESIPCFNQGGDSDGDGVCNNQDCAPNNPNLPVALGTACNDGNPNTNNDVIQSDGCTCQGTPVDPCAGQGGDSDGDGVCNNQDCQPNNPNFPATPGTACNDGNPNTQNDVVTSDGCGCAGTPVNNCSVSVSNCKVTISGLTSSDYAKVFNANWQVIWECNSWSGTPCNSTEMIDLPSNGTYWVQACGSTTSYTVTGCSVDPCANQGGDSDGDGVCNNQDCQPYNPNFPATPGTACNDGNPNTQNDVVSSDGCGCAGTPVNNCMVSVSNCKVTISGLTSSDYAKVFNSNWQVIWECNSWSGNPCNSTEMIDLPSNGTYWVQACGSTNAYTVTGCTPDPCANQGGDSDGDGVCNNQDCAPNNPNLPAAPGTACNDGNPNTNNDVIQSDGCTCQGTPVDPCAGQGGDSDGDGVCNNQDCQPNNPNFPATPGTACNDGNPNTQNDVVTSDGCGCAGTPVNNCMVSVSNCKVTISGLTSSDYAKVFNANWQVVWECNSWGGTLCNSTEMIDLPSNGTYWVQACGSTNAYTVTGCSVDPCAGQGGDSDGDGVCNNQDCAPNNPNLPAAPGTACNDGNPNTNNDVIQSDGCSCQGTPVDPCAGQGGDSDGDGVCNNQDCQPNNPNFPATPGTACNDGNPNTQNDVITSDGCGCAGTPVNNCMVSVNNCKVTISGLSSSDYAKVFNVNWQVIWECNPWSGTPCNSTEMIDLPSNGTYWVQACGSTNPYTVTGCTPDPCANQGGDSDGDGVCNNQDCAPNNPNLPAAPGTACNDGNPNTNNDVIQSDGCSCAGTPIDPCAGQGGDSDGDGICDNQDNCPTISNPSQSDSDGDGIGNACDNSNDCNSVTLVRYKMDNCVSFGSDGSNTDFSEFTPNYPNAGGCSNVSASNIFNNAGEHSCVDGANGSYAGICVAADYRSYFKDNDNNAIRFKVTVNGTGKLTNLSFYQLAPEYYQHISGNSGYNNYPRKFGFRILKNGTEIYQVDNQNTNQHNWEYESFNLSGADFEYSGSTIFDFEILGYNPVGSGSRKFFDVDDIRVKGCCLSNALTSAAQPILHMNAEKIGREVNVNWVSNTTYRTSHYLVERSADGVEFETVKQVFNTEDTQTPIYYEAVDNTPMLGYNFYRVRQVHFDGTSEVTDARRILFEIDLNELSLYPNPASNELFVNMKDFAGKPAVVQVFNTLGQLMDTQIYQAVPDTPVRMDLSKFKNGLYSVTIKVDGQRRYTEQFVVTKL